jgi:hypothetical protein
MQKTSNFILKASLFTACLSVTSFAFSTPSISLSQVTKDVTYLASDDLKGRDNFSGEIKQAASYIAKRFKESGLQNSTQISASNFLQIYQVTQVIPDNILVVLNNQTIAAENITMASTSTNVSWAITNGVKSGDFNIHNLDENADVRAVLSNINQQGGEHVVVLNPAHQNVFKRYQHYFEQGITKLTSQSNNNTKGGTIVIVLLNAPAENVENLSVAGVSRISKSELTNVVAVLPGTTKPNEVVLYSAHYDHLGQTDAKHDNIFNGADDNASGVTAILNIAQYHAKKGNNARTLMFAAFSAEEIGGFGSKYFSQQLDPTTISAMINIEMIGKPSKFGAGTVWMTGMERSNLGEQLNKTLSTSGAEIYKDPYPEQGLFYRSDNATLARLGVPAHSFSSTQLDKDEFYHKVTDDLSSLDLPSMHKVIEALTIATEPLVNATVTPSRIDVSTVKSKGLIY